MPSGSSHSHSMPSRIRTRTLSRVLCSPECGSGSRPACSSASAWKASNHASTSSASSSVARRSRPSGAGGTSTEVASHSRVALSVTSSPPASSAVVRASTSAPGQRPVGAAEELAARVERGGEGPGGVVVHRQGEGRVGLEGGGAHGGAHHGAGRRRGRRPTSARTARRPRPRSPCPSASSRAVRSLTLAITLPSTGSAASSSPAASRKGCGASKNSRSIAPR